MGHRPDNNEWSGIAGAIADCWGNFRLMGEFGLIGDSETPDCLQISQAPFTSHAPKFGKEGMKRDRNGSSFSFFV